MRAAYSTEKALDSMDDAFDEFALVMADIPLRALI